MEFVACYLVPNDAKSAFLCYLDFSFHVADFEVCLDYRNYLDFPYSEALICPRRQKVGWSSQAESSTI